MPNLAQAAVSDEPPPGPQITALFAALLEQEAARRGLPPEPWPLP